MVPLFVEEEKEEEDDLVVVTVLGPVSVSSEVVQ